MAIKFVNTPNIPQIQLYLEVIEGAQDIVNNKTTITYKAYLYNKYPNYYYNWTDTSMTVTVNGKAVATNSAVKYDFRTGTKEQAILTGTAVIPHDSDGTKTLASSVALKGVSHRGVGTTITPLNLSLPLTTIPRATEFTEMSGFDSSSGSISVKVDVKSTSFKHNFSLVVNSKSIRTWENLTLSSGYTSLTLSNADRSNLLVALPTQISATATMTLQTLSGTTVVGTRTKSATYTILDTVKPVITSPTISTESTIGAISQTSRAYAIQGVSEIKVSWGETIPGGTTFDSRSVSMGGITVSTSPAYFQATTIGTNTAVITVKDKRGRKATKSLSIDVTAYSPVSAQLIYLGRPRIGSNQARLQAEVNHVVSTLSGNKYDVIIKTKAVGTSTWTTVVNSRYTPDATHTREYNPTTVYNELKAFDTMITVKDDYSTATLLGVLPTTSYPLVIGKYGIGVGKVPQGDRVLDVQGDAYIDGTIYQRGRLQPYWQTQEASLTGLSQWYRIYTINNRYFAMDFKIIRMYNSPAPETYNIAIACAYAKASAAVLSKAVGGQIITQLRLVLASNGTVHIEVLYNSSYSNTCTFWAQAYPRKLHLVDVFTTTTAITTVSATPDGTLLHTLNL